MSARIRAAGIGLFIVLMLALGIGMALLVGNSNLWNKSKQRYELVFDSSVKGLEIGAPVTLKGVRVGEVVSVNARFYRDSNIPLNSVVVDINPDRIHFDDKPSSSLEDILLYSDFSAQLKTQSFLTGMLYLELDVYTDPPQTILVDTSYPQIQTVPSNLDKLYSFNEVDFVQIAMNLQQLVDNLQTFTSTPEFQALPGQFITTLASIDKSVAMVGGSADAMVQEMSVAMVTLQQSMKTMQDIAASIGYQLSADSPIVHNLNESLQSVSRAAKSVKQLTDMLEKNPEALISGKKGESVWKR